MDFSGILQGINAIALVLLLVAAAQIIAVVYFVTSTARKVAVFFDQAEKTGPSKYERDHDADEAEIRATRRLAKRLNVSVEEAAEYRAYEARYSKYN